MRSASVGPSTSSITSAIFHTVDGCDTRVVQRRHDPGLILKPSHAIAVLRETFWQDLDSDVAIELGIGSAVDRAIPPSPSFDVMR